MRRVIAPACWSPDGLLLLPPPVSGRRAGAADLRLTVEELAAIASAMPAVSGLRYPEASMRSVGL